MSAEARPARTRQLTLPTPRGPLSERLMWLLRRPPGTSDKSLLSTFAAPGEPLVDEDLQLSLYLLNELHYASLEGVDERWEWSAALAPLRELLEETFEEALDRLVGEITPADTDCIGETLQRLVEEDDGPPLSRFAEREATLEQMLEHVIHRSAYQLKEADPHSFTIPRLTGRAKAALVEIQFDEYGEGHAGRMHSELFAATMAALGLDPAYGFYLEQLPGLTLATVNLMSLFGLHRRRRGALVGHLAVFEMTSSVPNRRYGNALRRLGYGTEATAFYDEHVAADAVHESIAVWDLADGLAREDPDLAAGIVFGARALLALEGMWAGHLLQAWQEGASSLRSAASYRGRFAADGEEGWSGST